VLAAGPTLAATLINAHAEVGTGEKEVGNAWYMTRTQPVVKIRNSPLLSSCLQSKPEGKTARFVGGTAELWGRIVVFARQPRATNAVVSSDSFFSQVRSSLVFGFLSCSACRIHIPSLSICKYEPVLCLFERKDLLWRRSGERGVVVELRLDPFWTFAARRVGIGTAWIFLFSHHLDSHKGPNFVCGTSTQTSPNDVTVYQLPRPTCDVPPFHLCPSPQDSSHPEPSIIGIKQAVHWAIIANVVVIGMGGYNIGEKKGEVLSIMETVLTITFTVEAAIKITVLGCRRYFTARCVRKTNRYFLRQELESLQPGRTRRPRVEAMSNVSWIEASLSMACWNLWRITVDNQAEVQCTPSLSCDNDWGVVGGNSTHAVDLSFWVCVPVRRIRFRWNRFDFFVSMCALLHLVVKTLVNDLVRSPM